MQFLLLDRTHVAVPWVSTVASQSHRRLQPVGEGLGYLTLKWNFLSEINTYPKHTHIHTLAGTSILQSFAQRTCVWSRRAVRLNIDKPETRCACVQQKINTFETQLLKTSTFLPLSCIVYTLNIITAPCSGVCGGVYTFEYMYIAYGLTRPLSRLWYNPNIYLRRS